MIKTVFLNAKCSDCCDIWLEDGEYRSVEEHQGYLPKIPGLGGGDYIELEIDNETGVIKNWVPIITLKGNE